MSYNKNKKNGNLSFAEQKALLAGYEAVKESQKSALTFKPGKAKEVSCNYCKGVGHRIKSKSGVLECPKLIAKGESARARNTKGRAVTKTWQEETSVKAMEGGSGGGWKTAGSSDKTASKLEYKKPVVKVANAYDFGADEWNEIGAARQRAAEEREREEEEKKAREEAAELALGRWNKPLVKEVVEEKTVDGAKKCPGCEDWGCVDCN
jgi:hypothetical protein